jgi:uncharacterized YigZ family protein
MKYKTPQREAQVEQTIKKSKFIATVTPVNSVEEAEAFFSRIKNEFKKATHNVPAYRIGKGKSEKKYYSDDREPSGSAGLPVFNAIKSMDVTNCAVVVTRYFGGIKLGVGGLIRAYHSTAKGAIEMAGTKEISIKTSVNLCFPYGETRLAMYFIHKYGAKIIKEDYRNTVKLVISIDEDVVDDFKRAVNEKTNKIIFC